MSSALYYVLFCGICITILKEFNVVVDEPYMDEPFHVPQAQAYCRGDYSYWDPKITTPPGLYVMSLILHRIFMFKCTLPMLRLTTVLSLMALPIVLERLLAYHQRRPPSLSLFVPSLDAIILALFPIAWFFGFLYYTDVPSVVLVVSTVVAASEGKHWLAALLGLTSCTFRQTNIIWVLYAYASSQLTYLRFRRAAPGAPAHKKLHDPPALTAGPSDLMRSVVSAPNVVLDVLPSFIPYGCVLGAFCAFVIWNGGIVLGDKSNHIPALHIPQLYYFIAFSTAFGWPIFLSQEGSLPRLLHDVKARMFGSKSRLCVTVVLGALMAISVHFFTIHHPFLLSDNRHYTFYVWRRVFRLHPAVPYLLIPIYMACAWAWFLRVGNDQTMLQSLILPMFLIPTLLPTPLLEPRYFLIPYILLRAQVVDVPTWGLAVEGVWYAAINAATMWVFLYKSRPGIGRFMW